MSQPAERIWVIHTMYVPLADGGRIPAIEVDPADPRFVGCEFIANPTDFAIAMSEVQAILTRIGGVVQIATRRREVSPGRIETLAVIIRHRNFVPLDKSQQAPPIEQEDTPAQAEAPPLPVPDDLLADGPVTHESVAAVMPPAEPTATP